MSTKYVITFQYKAPPGKQKLWLESEGQWLFAPHSNNARVYENQEIAQEAADRLAGKISNEAVVAVEPFEPHTAQCSCDRCYLEPR